MADIHPISIARVHDDPGDSAAARILVDRLWPRGIRKDSLHHDAWIKEVAPSTGLRQWFGHDPERWDGFRKRYVAELDANPDAVGECLDWCRRGPVVLLFAARDRDHNQAVVLRDYLCRLLEQDSEPGKDA